MTVLHLSRISSVKFGASSSSFSLPHAKAKCSFRQFRSIQNVSKPQLAFRLIALTSSSLANLAEPNFISPSFSKFALSLARPASLPFCELPAALKTSFRLTTGIAFELSKTTGIFTFFTLISKIFI